MPSQPLQMRRVQEHLGSSPTVPRAGMLEREVPVEEVARTAADDSPHALWILWRIANGKRVSAAERRDLAERMGRLNTAWQRLGTWEGDAVPVNADGSDVVWKDKQED